MATIYYSGDYDGLWDPECDDIGYIGNFDGQSESSNPRDFYCDEWMDWCDFNAPDRYYGFSPQDGEAQLPVSKCTPLRAVEETTTPGRLQEDSFCTSVMWWILTPGR